MFSWFGPSFVGDLEKPAAGRWLVVLDSVQNMFLAFRKRREEGGVSCLPPNFFLKKSQPWFSVVAF